MMLCRLAAPLALAVSFVVAPALATQNELIPPTTGVYTGVQFSNLLGNAFRSLASSNSGSSAAANVSGAAVKGLWWLDTSVTPNLAKLFTGTDFVVVGALDQANALWSPPLGAGRGQLTAASTTDLGSVPQAYVEITGTTAITSFGSTAPAYSSKIVKFLSATPLTYSSALPVPGGYSLTMDAGAKALATHLGSGNWEFVTLARASGEVIDAARVGSVAYNWRGALPGNALYGYGQAISRTTYPAYLAKVTRAQNGTRTSGNATITSVGDTSGMGAGMPIEGTGLSGCTIASVTASTIVVSSSGCVTSSGTSTVTAFLTGYGSGGSTSTVGVPACDGYLIAGRDDASGSARGNITNAGSAIVGTQLNATGGNEKVTIQQPNLPNATVAVSGSVSSTKLAVAAGSGVTPEVSAPTGGDFSLYLPATFGAIGTLSLTSGVTASINGGVTQTAVNKMPPTTIANCVVYVQP